MATMARNEIKDLIVDPEKFVPELTESRVRMLLMELEMLFEEYERENVIMYLASNYSNNKHLSMTALRSMHDDEIKELLDRATATLKEEMAKRKSQRSSNLP